MKVPCDVSGMLLGSDTPASKAADHPAKFDSQTHYYYNPLKSECESGQAYFSDEETQLFFLPSKVNENHSEHFLFSSKTWDFKGLRYAKD